MIHISTTLLILAATYLLAQLTGLINISGLALGASNWILWLGLFALIAITLLFFKRPLKTKELAGRFDHPIYSKPAFKIASVLIIFLAFGLLFV